MKAKRILMALVLTCTVLCSVGCGRRMNSATDGTDKNNTTMEDNNSDRPETNDGNTTIDGTSNDVRDDNVVDSVMNGVEDTVDGVMNGIDDVVNGTENTIDDTTNDGNANDNVLPDNQDNTVNDQNNVNHNR